MDMKRILQALDGASTKPVEGANDMSKFLSIINKNDVSVLKEEQNNNLVLNEGANPHKVSLPVQMAMQHYQQQPQTKPRRPALIDKYFKQVEDEIIAEKQERRQLINQYAQQVAERVMMKEGKGEGAWHVSPSGVKTNMPPSDDDYDINYGADGAAAGMNQEDVISLDVPLLIRLLEYAREDAQTDMDLHNVAERLIDMSSEGETLTMSHYDSIVGSEEQPENQSVAEAVGKKIKPKNKSNPCWTGYTQVGMQKKDGKTVPKCVQKQYNKK